VKNLRYLQQNNRARISHDLVMTRIGELSIRDLEVLTRMLLYPLTTISAAITEGLIASLDSGMDINVSAPASCIQNLEDEDVRICLDYNSGADYGITLSNGDSVNDRYDIIQCQIRKRSAFTDTSVDIVDPVTKTVTPTTLDRDFEIYLHVEAKEGTPAGSPVPPSPDAATAGTLLGTVTTDVLDLSSEYILNLSVGEDSEYVQIDLRGVTPSATTLVERLANINAAGFGTIATDSGGAILLTAPGVGENSVIRIKQPLDPALDCYNRVLGGTESLGYVDEFFGDNGYFKVAEIFVPAAATSLIAGNIKSRTVKDDDWQADASTIENVTSLDAHRKSVPIDHADNSIFTNHLDASVIDTIQKKLTLLRGSYSKIYQPTVFKASLFFSDVEVVTVLGESQLHTDVEQEFPVHRIDQISASIGGSGYSVPVSLVEDAANRREFNPGGARSTIPVQFFAENHSRIGLYITNGASTAAFTSVLVTLHNSAHSVLATANILIADLQAVNVGWIHVDLVASLTVGQTYHYHLEMVGETSPTPPVFGNQSGTGADTMAFREMYLPDSGKYGSADTEDVPNFIDSQTGLPVVDVRVSGEDDIINPGDGYIQATSGADIMAADFSDTSDWDNWAEGADLIGVDIKTGRLKGLDDNGRAFYAEFNVSEGVDEQDAKNTLRHEITKTIEDSLTDIESGFTYYSPEFIEDVYGNILNRPDPAVVTNDRMKYLEMASGVDSKIRFELSGPPKGTERHYTSFVPTLELKTPSGAGDIKLRFEFFRNESTGPLFTTDVTYTPGSSGVTTKDFESLGVILFLDMIYNKYSSLIVEISRVGTDVGDTSAEILRIGAITLRHLDLPNYS
jgi:hypothetical protein